MCSSLLLQLYTFTVQYTPYTPSKTKRGGGGRQVCLSRQPINDCNEELKDPPVLEPNKLGRVILNPNEWKFWNHTFSKHGGIVMSQYQAFLLLLMCIY